jgi:hypothetical protein
MKRAFFAGLFVAVSVCLLLAQGKVGSGTHRGSKFQSYNPNSPPPLALADAYNLALDHLGKATNRFFCISASCLEMTNAGFTGWTFSFSNTNRERGRVDVYFDKDVVSVARPGEILIR